MIIRQIIQISLLVAALGSFLACNPRVREGGPPSVESSTVRRVWQCVLMFAHENDGRLPSREELVDRFAEDWTFEIPYELIYLPTGTEREDEVPERFIVAMMASDTGVWVAYMNGNREQIRTKH